MPTYVYKFVETGETIEIQQAFTDESLTEAVHPETGLTMPVKKVFLPVGVTFKGGGFYKTDSRKGSSAGSSGSSGGESGTSSDSSSPSSTPAAASSGGTSSGATSSGGTSSGGTSSSSPSSSSNSPASSGSGD